MLHSTGYSSRRAEIRKSDKTRVWHKLATEGRAHTSDWGQRSLCLLTRSDVQFLFSILISFYAGFVIVADMLVQSHQAARAVMRSEKCVTELL